MTWFTHRQVHFSEKCTVPACARENLHAGWCHPGVNSCHPAGILGVPRAWILRLKAWATTKPKWNAAGPCSSQPELLPKTQGRCQARQTLCSSGEQIATLSVHFQLAGQPQKRTPMFQARTTRFFVDAGCHDHDGACGCAAHAEPPRQGWAWLFILVRLCFYNPKSNCVVPTGEGELNFTIPDVMTHISWHFDNASLL